MMTATDHVEISLLASKAAAGLARTLLTPKFHKWGYSAISHDALLVAGELVSNASRAAPKQEIKVRARHDAAGLLIGVWDPSPELPRRKPLVELTLDTLDLSEESLDDNGGRGLPIVQALSDDCGYNLDPSGGKWVWARLKAV